MKEEYIDEKEKDKNFMNNRGQETQQKQNLLNNSNCMIVSWQVYNLCQYNI